jgi:uracil-DNA glycosylase family 4
MVQKRLMDYISNREIINEELMKLYEEIQKCQNCELYRLEVNKYRPHLKIGNKPILIVSQNPSVFRNNLPYVWGGLDKLIKNLPPERAGEVRKILDKVYISNIVKCSTPENRTPSSTEIKSCFKWLKEEVRIISPEKIIVLGIPARKGLENKFNDVIKIFLRHPISTIREGEALKYSYELEEAIIN